jgi:predicted amidohydrolase YtcJ
MRAAGFFLVAAAGLLPAAAARADVKAVVDERVAEWWPTPEEKRFDQIGWAADLHTARKLAAEHDRPVFLFTMDGRVNLGRC